MAEVFANPLVDLAEYTDMKQDLDQGKGPVQISGVTDSQKVHVMNELSKDNPWRLVVTYDDTRAKEIFDDFSYFEPCTSHRTRHLSFTGLTHSNSDIPELPSTRFISSKFIFDFIPVKCFRFYNGFKRKTIFNITNLIQNSFHLL